MYTIHHHTPTSKQYIDQPSTRNPCRVLFHHYWHDGTHRCFRQFRPSSDGGKNATESALTTDDDAGAFEVGSRATQDPGVLDLRRAARILAAVPLAAPVATALPALLGAADVILGDARDTVGAFRS